MQKDRNVFKVLRVTHLDANKITNDLHSILSDQIKRSIQKSPFTVLLHLEPEFKATLRWILWKFSIQPFGISIGQQMLSTAYESEDGNLMTERQKHIYLLIYVVVYWLKDRERELLKTIETLLQFLGKSYYIPIVTKFVINLGKLVQFLSLANFLYFIKNAKYGNLLEHVVKVRHVYQNKPSPRYIDYKYMRKEMLWESLTQTMLAIVPLINFRTLVSKANRYVKLLPFFNEALISFDDRLICGICLEKATNPYCGECNHVFCYFCLQGNIGIDQDFECTQCGRTFGQIKPI